MRYRQVLFDVGDTLVQVPEPAPIYWRVLTRRGCPIGLADMERIVAETRRIMDERIPRWVSEDLKLDPKAAARRRALHVETVVSLAGAPNAEAARQALFDLYVGTELFTLYPDVVDTLQQLRVEGYRLGVVSNWEPRLRQLMAAHDIDQYFDFVVVSELEGYLKPHPALYRRALELAGVPADRVVHVGDKLREDVEGAAALGICGILLDRGDGLGVGYEPRISALRELPGLLARGG